MKAKQKARALAIREGLIDPDALRTHFAALCDVPGDTGSQDIRTELLSHLKTVYANGLQKARDILNKDGRGLKCTHRISSLQDELIRAIHDFAVTYVHHEGAPELNKQMAIIPVGGYGRGTLAPQSDIDLLFLLPQSDAAWCKDVIEYILYMLWDMGFKVGHATRTIEECITLSQQDMTIRTSILEARFLLGNQELFTKLTEKFKKSVMAGTSIDFVNAKMEERENRHKKEGGSRYLVEPNVKEGKGGLRDLQALYWMAKYVYGVNTTSALVKEGVFNSKEHRMFQKSEDFLWTVRCHLHFLAGRPEERLSFDLQREMSQILNYTSHAGLRDVERFMKHYFLVAKDVGDLTSILCAKLEERQVKIAPSLNRFLEPFRKIRRRRIKGITAFEIDNNRLIAKSADIFTEDPANFIHVFALADRLNADFHPDLRHLIKRSISLINRKMRTDKETNKAFLSLLADSKHPEAILRKMNEAGVLGRFIPEFGKIVSMMQFNMYHHYTVDEHLLRAVGVLADIERGTLIKEHPVSHEILRKGVNRMVIYFAIFLHDIAKGRPEDHSIAGEKVARRLAKRFALSASEVDTIGWLIREHLTMSIVAQSRDLSDRRTIEDFASIVQTPERLKMLMVLTVCDIKAVGPGVWNAWKAQLLRTLYFETEPLLSGGYSTTATNERLKYARKALSEKLSTWSKAERQAYVKTHYPAYLLRTELDMQVRHAETIRAAKQAGQEIATASRSFASEGTTEISVFAADHERMLMTLAGVCADMGATILGAQVFTTKDGRAIDIINIRRKFPGDEDEERRAKKISARIIKALKGEAKPDQPSQQVIRKASKAFKVQTDIVVSNTISDAFTVIEASGKDRVGLLYSLTKQMHELNLNIASAHIATFGERAVDVFYVTDLLGNKITNAKRHERIINEMKAAFEKGVVTKVGQRVEIDI